MNLTIEDKNIGKDVVGYILCKYLSDHAKKEIEKIQNIIFENFGDAVWLAPLDSLHITLMDWLAPFVEYHKDKDILFNEIFSEYDNAIEKALFGKGIIEVIFNKIVVTDAAIILIGEDGGKFNSIREDFLNKIELIENTKKPPRIVHTTICRFKKELEISKIENTLDGVKINFQETVNGFDLVKASKSPMLDFSIIKNYKL